MSYEVEIDNELNLATIKTIGHMEVEDIAQALHEIIVERSISSSHSILVDLSEYKSVPTAGEIIEISKHVYSHWHGMKKRISIVAPGGMFFDLACLATRYISLLSERANGKSLPARVFTDYEEAKNWCCYR